MFQIKEKFMKMALRVARKNLGIVSPNPSVGCIIVKNDRLLSIGYTQAGGVPHAEIVALNKLKSDVETTEHLTMYVTLEPCSHYGKTKPCVISIVESGIKTVVIAALDPDPRVSGRGFRYLEEKGINVLYGVCEDQAKLMNIGFFMNNIINRPHITLKLATTMDGKLAAYNGKSRWITSSKSRTIGHFIRSKNDALVVGRGTLDSDDPALNCRINGLEDYSPQIIIITNSDIDVSKYKLFKAYHSKPVILIVGLNTNITGYHDEIAQIKICRISSTNKNTISLKEAFSEIGSYGINNVLIESGGRLATSLLKEDLIDEIIWFKSDSIAGNDGIPAFGDMVIANVSDFYRFSLKRIKKIDNNVISFLSRENILKLLSNGK